MLELTDVLKRGHEAAEKFISALKDFLTLRIEK